MKTQTIQHSERYEAPGIKVKMLKRKVSLMATSFTLGGTTESNEGDTTTEPYGEDNGTW